MKTRKRYRLDKVDVFPTDSRPASWTFAGAAMRGTEHAYAVTDTNLSSRNQWEFIVRAPADPRERVEVRPRSTPNVAVWAELPDRSLTFMPATRGPARGKWYCQIAFADAEGKKSKTVIKADQKGALPHWFRDVASRIRQKETVKPTKGTDGNALVVLVPAGDHSAMIRLFFATKVWVLSEGIVL